MKTAGTCVKRTTIAKTYGISYERARHLVYTATVESEHVSEPGHASVRRTAISFGATYNNQDSQTGRLRLEYSSETGKTNDQNRKTWCLSSHYETRVDADWHFLTGVDALFSKHSGGNFRDAEYFEGTLGYARCPIFDERLNLMLKYTYLHDLPAPDQIAKGDAQAGPLKKAMFFRSIQFINLFLNYHSVQNMHFENPRSPQDRSSANLAHQARIWRLSAPIGK